MTVADRVVEIVDSSAQQRAALPAGTIGIITAEITRYATFWKTLPDLKAPSGSRMVQSTGLSIAENREHLALNRSGEWLLTLDDDLVLLPSTLTRLLEVMFSSDDPDGWDIVCAYTLRRTPPFDALVYLTDPLEPEGCDPWVPDRSKGVVEVAAGGLGAVLIRNRVFDRLERPWFRVGQVNPMQLHEDVDFFRRARLEGFRACVCLDAPVGHVTPMAVWPALDDRGTPTVALVGHDGGVVPVNRGTVRNLPRQPRLIGL